MNTLGVRSINLTHVSTLARCWRIWPRLLSENGSNFSRNESDLMWTATMLYSAHFNNAAKKAPLIILREEKETHRAITRDNKRSEERVFWRSLALAVDGLWKRTAGIMESISLQHFHTRAGQNSHTERPNRTIIIQLFLRPALHFSPQRLYFTLPSRRSWPILAELWH